jgi:hypothetical protein
MTWVRHGSVGGGRAEGGAVAQALILTVALVAAAGLLSSATGSRWPLALLVAGMLGQGVLRLDWRRDIVRPYRAIRPRHLAIGVLTILLPVTSFILTADVPVLNWSLLTLVGQENGNVAAAGLEVGPWFAAPYLLLLLACLPMLALVEEYWFRRGTRGWRDGLGRSLLFGLVHALVGVPLGVAILGLGAVGLVLTGVYLRAVRRPPEGAGPTGFAVERLRSTTPDERRGIDAAAVQHLAYNTIALTVAAVAVVLSTVGI